MFRHTRRPPLIKLAEGQLNQLVIIIILFYLLYTYAKNVYVLLSIYTYKPNMFIWTTFFPLKTTVYRFIIKPFFALSLLLCFRRGKWGRPRSREIWTLRREALMPWCRPSSVRYVSIFQWNIFVIIIITLYFQGFLFWIKRTIPPILDRNWEN